MAREADGHGLQEETLGRSTEDGRAVLAGVGVRPGKADPPRIAASLADSLLAMTEEEVSTQGEKSAAVTAAVRM